MRPRLAVLAELQHKILSDRQLLDQARKTYGRSMSVQDAVASYARLLLSQQEKELISERDSAICGRFDSDYLAQESAENIYDDKWNC